MEIPLVDENTVHPHEARMQYWKAIYKDRHPEELACYVQTTQSPWSVVTLDGPEIQRQRRVAYLANDQELPYWAYYLAKSYLEDVEEWPLFGGKAEFALNEWLEHHDPVRATHEIMAAIKPVWPDVEISYIGEEQQ